MRLLDVHQLKLKQFPNDKSRPPYAILSHTWGDDEVSLQDLNTHAAASMVGYAKIKKACEVAIQDGFEYIWIDTCCIDKTSSAELSEAINSMYKWYQSADVCYAYLSDMQSGDNPTDPYSSFSESRWFTRGWTLQELLAPNIVIFYDCNWAEIGTKRSIKEDISRITGIPPEVLINEAETETFSIAQRMSWAAKRETTRVEDIAYCLMGIFDVNMPTLYGEGRKAFIRLQYEIMKRSNDQSLFAWVFERSQEFRPDYTDPDFCDAKAGRRVLMDFFSRPVNPWNIETSGVLSSSPRCFQHSGGVLNLNNHISKHSFSTTNNGLHIWLPMVEVPTEYVEVYQVILDCVARYSRYPLTIFLKRDVSGQYSRVFPTLVCPGKNLEYNPEPVELYAKEDYPEDPEREKVHKRLNYQFRLVGNSSPSKGYTLLGASSPQIFQKKMVNLLLGSGFSQAGIAYIIFGANHDPAAQYLVILGGIMNTKPLIFYSIRVEKNDIERIIAAIDKYGNQQPSVGEFDSTFRRRLEMVYIGERIVQELPSGQTISITFRKGPQSRDGVHICHLIVEFVTPTGVELPTLIC